MQKSMQDVVVGQDAPVTAASEGGMGPRFYAEPLSGLQVSWGAVMAGTVAMLAVSLLLWVLALAIVSLITHTSPESLKASMVALWICAMVATLVGAFPGGFLAGYLPGNRRIAVGVAHGFLAWCVALLAVFAFQIFVARSLLTTAAAVVVPTPGASPTSASNDGNLTESRDSSPVQDIPREPRDQGQGEMRAARAAINSVTGVGWSWFGTWFVAGWLALGGAAAGAGAGRRGGGRHAAGRGEPSTNRPLTPSAPPLSPAPTP